GIRRWFPALRGSAAARARLWDRRRQRWSRLQRKPLPRSAARLGARHRVRLPGLLREHRQSRAGVLAILADRSDEPARLRRRRAEREQLFLRLRLERREGLVRECRAGDRYI